MRDGNLRDMFQQHLWQAHWQAIETGAIGSGTPDSNWCWDGAEGWVEFKATTTLAVPLRPSQVAWLSRRARVGGRVHIAVRRKTLGGPRLGRPVDELWVLQGGEAEAVLASGLSRSAPYVLGVWNGGPKVWDWEGVGLVLRGLACCVLHRLQAPYGPGEGKHHPGRPRDTQVLPGSPGMHHWTY